MDIETALRLHYDAIAERYEGVDQGVERVLSALRNLRLGPSILDIGCGTGNLTFRLPEASPFHRVVGVDISDGVLNVARKHAAEHGLRNFEFIRASAASLPFNDGEFDAVVSNMVFHLLPDRRKVLQEVLRILKPSGRAVIQSLGGDDVMPEAMEILRDAWHEVLPQGAVPNLLQSTLAANRVALDTVRSDLLAVGIQTFEILWRRNIMKIGEAELPEWLEFFDLVGGFWRCAVSRDEADRIGQVLSARVMDVARAQGAFNNTVNTLLIQFAKRHR